MNKILFMILALASASGFAMGKSAPSLNQGDSCVRKSEKIEAQSSRFFERFMGTTCQWTDPREENYKELKAQALSIRSTLGEQGVTPALLAQFNDLACNQMLPLQAAVFQTYKQRQNCGEPKVEPWKPAPGSQGHGPRKGPPLEPRCYSYCAGTVSDGVCSFYQTVCN